MVGVLEEVVRQEEQLEEHERILTVSYEIDKTRIKIIVTLSERLSKHIPYNQSL